MYHKPIDEPQDEEQKAGTKTENPVGHSYHPRLLGAQQNVLKTPTKDSPKHCVPRAANSDAVKWKDLERLQVCGPMSHTCPRMTVSWPNTQQKLVGNMSLSTNLLKM